MADKDRFSMINARCPVEHGARMAESPYRIRMLLMCQGPELAWHLWDTTAELISHSRMN